MFFFWGGGFPYVGFFMARSIVAADRSATTANSQRISSVFILVTVLEPFSTDALTFGQAISRTPNSDSFGFITAHCSRLHA